MNFARYAQTRLPEKYVLLFALAMLSMLNLIRTKCNKCHRLKAISAYSNKQVDSLRSGLAIGRIRNTDHAKGEHIKCKECTGTINEKQCAACRVWKNFDDFSKAQRRMGDDAVSIRFRI